MSLSEERSGIFNLNEAAAWNQAEVSGQGPVRIKTNPSQWAYATLFPIHDDPERPLAKAGALLVRVDAEVEVGAIGIAIAERTLSKFISPEVRQAAGGGRITIEIPLNAPPADCWLVIRNAAGGNTSSLAAIHRIQTFVTPVAE